MPDIDPLFSWAFFSESPIPNDISNVLVTDEVAIAAYKTIRDSAVFTNKRLIVRDSQGLTGKKVEMYSLPYDSIHMWSTENAGATDLDAEVQLWSGAGKIRISLRRGIDVRRFDKLIAEAIL